MLLDSGLLFWATLYIINCMYCTHGRYIHPGIFRRK